MGEHFARGRSAEIFRTEDGKILKLFFPGMSFCETPSMQSITKPKRPSRSTIS